MVACPTLKKSLNCASYNRSGIVPRLRAAGFTLSDKQLLCRIACAGRALQQVYVKVPAAVPHSANIDENTGGCRESPDRAPPGCNDVRIRQYNLQGMLPVHNDITSHHVVAGSPLTTLAFLSGSTHPPHWASFGVDAFKIILKPC